MKTTTIFLITIIILATACEKESENIVLYDANFDFGLRNAKGEDLLSKHTEGTYNTDKIRLYNVIDGQAILIPYQGLLDHPWSYLIFLEKDTNWIRPMPIQGKNPFTDTGTDKTHVYKTLIEWNENETDTIDLIQDIGQKGIARIKYNSKEVWNGYNTSARRFTIYK